MYLITNMYTAVSLKRQTQKIKINRIGKPIHLRFSMHGKFNGIICQPEKCYTNNKKRFKNTNGKIIKSTMKDDLDVPMPLDISIQAYIFSNINNSLVSIEVLCDAGCKVTFKIKNIILVYKDKKFYEGVEITKTNCGISHSQ